MEEEEEEEELVEDESVVVTGRCREAEMSWETAIK